MAHPWAMTFHIYTSDQVEVECSDREEGTANTKNLHEVGRGKPLFLDEGDDELGCHQRESEHEWEGNEASEAQHLGEHATKAFEVITHFHKSRLRHTLHHTSDGVGSHRVPLVCLGVSTHLHLRVDFS